MADEGEKGILAEAAAAIQHGAQDMKAKLVKGAEGFKQDIKTKGYIGTYQDEIIDSAAYTAGQIAKRVPTVVIAEAVTGGDATKFFEDLGSSFKGVAQKCRDGVRDAVLGDHVAKPEASSPKSPNTNGPKTP